MTQINYWGRLSLRIALFCLLPISSFAQTINGTIKSQSGEAIGFASISVLNRTVGTVADRNRDFQLSLPQGCYQLSVNAVGYAAYIQPVTASDKTVELAITLTENTISLTFRNIDFSGFYHSFYQSAIGEKLPPQRVWSQELRLSSTDAANPLLYTVGVYGFTQVGYEPSTNLAYELSPTSFAIFRTLANNRGIALFGELSNALTPTLKVTAGLRYDNEHREAKFNGFGDAAFIKGVVTTIRPDTTVSGNYSAFSPKLALTYTLSERSSLFATYTRGFRAGGVNAQRVPRSVRQTFDPEFSDNYEIGYKIRSASGRFSLGTSAFWIQWCNLQFFNLVAPFTYARENVGNASLQGLELETSAIPAKGLQLDARLGLNSTAYEGFTVKRVNYATGAETATEVSGNRLSNAPGHTIYLAAQYRRPLTGKLTGMLRAEVRNLGQYYTDIQNTLSQPTYTLLNVRAGLTQSRYKLWAQCANGGPGNLWCYPERKILTTSFPCPKDMVRFRA